MEEATTKQHHAIVLVGRGDKGTYGASLPDIAGVFATGRSLSELLANEEEALQLRFFDEDGQLTGPLPEPRYLALTVTLES